MKFQKGFTLIELLVVIAIIGILASVVLASLNSARTKGQEVSIKSNLRNMIAAAELSYDTVGNYSAVCTSVQPMMDAIQNVTGVAPRCFSYNNSGFSDVYIRWGVSATNAAKNKNWSVDGNGVVTWDTVDASGSMQDWNVGTSACAALGKKLPSLEQLKSLHDTHGATPPGFNASAYWSNTTVPSASTLAYYFYFVTGVPGDAFKYNSTYIRCVQ